MSDSTKIPSDQFHKILHQSLRLLLTLTVFLELVKPSSATIIPLTYYSDMNLPFGFGSDIKVTYDSDSAVQAFNMSINTNTPFTLLFGFDGNLNFEATQTI